MKHGKTQRINWCSLYDELEITNELYKDRAHRVRKREGVSDNIYNILRSFVARLLGYHEKEEIMRQRHKLKDTMCSV